MVGAGSPLGAPMSLALATLIHEWRRYLPAVIALAFSGVLILAQVGLMTGLVRAVTATLDRSRADLVVMPPKMDSMIGSASLALPSRVGPRLYLSPDVAAIGVWEMNGADWRNIPGPGRAQRQLYVRVFMVETEPDAVTLPRDFTEGARKALEAPLAAAVDRSALANLGVQVGDPALLAGQTVIIRAAVEGYASVEAPTVFVSRDTMIRLGLMTRGDQTGPLLLRLKDPAAAARARDFLNANSGGDYRAWLTRDLAKANETAFLREQIVGVLLGFSVFLSLLIGVGITSQTLRGAIASNIREFASLRALGVSMASLRGVVVELSFWVGIAGLAATAALMAGVLGLAALLQVSVGLTAPFVIGVAGLLMAISLVSGFLSLGALARSQPAELLR